MTEQSSERLAHSKQRTFTAHFLCLLFLAAGCNGFHYANMRSAQKLACKKIQKFSVLSLPFYGSVAPFLLVVKQSFNPNQTLVFFSFTDNCSLTMCMKFLMQTGTSVHLLSYDIDVVEVMFIAQRRNTDYNIGSRHKSFIVNVSCHVSDLQYCFFQLA